MTVFKNRDRDGERGNGGNSDKIAIPKLATTAAIVSIATLLGLAACSQQQFSLPSESTEYGQRVTYATDVDVLWVIDTSGSMEKRQNQLAAQVGVFVDALDQTQLNYQMAVTSMDMSPDGEKGRFIAQGGTPTVLTPSTPDLAGVLASRLRIGANGSPVERGLQTMKNALSAPLATTGTNQGFLRANSLLVVIFLTDEEDESVDDDYVGFLDHLRPPLPSGDRSWVAHFMGVVADDPACRTAEWGAFSVGTRYMTLAQASNGVVESICDADLRRALTNVKARVLEVTTEYPLDREPNIDSIVVLVDGRTVPKNEENGWTYYAPKNSIRFHGTEVPKPGSMIRVTFDPKGLK